jgi:hypothetical protein
MTNITWSKQVAQQHTQTPDIAQGLDRGGLPPI